MSRPNPLVLMVILVGLTGALGWLTLSEGGFYLSSHEGDTLHLLDILFRMNSGAWPHLDFVTPLGILGFLPFTALMSYGYSVGDALLYGQVLAAAVLLPFIFYVAWSRLQGWVAYAFVAMMMVMALALSFGGTAPGLSMSMHYNRWAWVVASLVVVMGLLPRRGRDAPLFDGVLVAVFFSALVLTKITFFVALFPGVAAALLLQGRRSEFFAALVAGLAIAGALIVALTPAFWFAYAADLANVAGSDVRPHTGLAFADIVASARFIGVTLVGFLGFLFVHRSGFRPQAVGLILLFPGFLFITWQNFGNDPKWLVPLAAVLMTLAFWDPEEDGQDHRSGMKTLAAIAAVLFLPSAMTLAVSPIKHAGQNIEAFEPLLTGGGVQDDIFVRRDRGFTMMAEQFQDDPGDDWDRFADLIEREAPTEINGIAFPQCEFLAGSAGWLRTIGEDLRSLGVEEGAAFFTTDILSSFWLYEPFTPLRNGAPWYYGDLSGIENADYIVVPKCGFAERVRQIIISELAESGLTFETVAETERLALFRVAQ